MRPLPDERMIAAVKRFADQNRDVSAAEAVLKLLFTEQELEGLRNAVSFAGYDYFDNTALVNGLMEKLQALRSLKKKPA